MVGKKSGKALLREEGRNKTLRARELFFDSRNRLGED